MYQSPCPEIQNLDPNSVFVLPDGGTTDTDTIAEQIETWQCPVTDQYLRFINIIRDLSHTKQTFIVSRRENGYELWLRLDRWLEGTRPNAAQLRSNDIEKIITDAGFSFIDARVNPNNPRQVVVRYTDKGVQKYARLPLHGEDLARRRRNTFRKRV